MSDDPLRKAAEAAVEALEAARDFAEEEQDNRYAAIVDSEYSRAPTLLIGQIDAALSALRAALEAGERDGCRYCKAKVHMSRDGSPYHVLSYFEGHELELELCVDRLPTPPKE